MIPTYLVAAIECLHPSAVTHKYTVLPPAGQILNRDSHTANDAKSS